MITIRKHEDRGCFDHGWLKTCHTFSFADYQDPEFMGFRSLRVINEDRVAPARGFGTHGHRDMEIVSYVLSGTLGHHDSMGTGSVIRPGEVQRMSAGSGVMHSEMNASSEMPLHFLQIWILPDRRGIAPGYEQKMFEEKERRGRLRVVGSRDGREGSVTINQDVTLYSALLDRGERVQHVFEAGRAGWLQVARGVVSLDGHDLRTSDGAAITDEQAIEIRGEKAEVLLFDLG